MDDPVWVSDASKAIDPSPAPVVSTVTPEATVIVWLWSVTLAPGRATLPSTVTVSVPPPPFTVSEVVPAMVMLLVSNEASELVTWTFVLSEGCWWTSRVSLPLVPLTVTDAALMSTGSRPA